MLFEHFVCVKGSRRLSVEESFAGGYGAHKSQRGHKTYDNPFHKAKLSFVGLVIHLYTDLQTEGDGT